MQGDRDAVYERVICKEARKQVGIGNQEKTSAENQEKQVGTERVPRGELVVRARIYMWAAGLITF